MKKKLYAKVEPRRIGWQSKRNSLAAANLALASVQTNSGSAEREREKF